MKMRACLVELMRENDDMLAFIRDKIEGGDVPKDADLRIWKEAFLPYVDIHLRRTDFFGRRKAGKFLHPIFAMLDRMLGMERETAVYVSVYLMQYLHENLEVLKTARTYMSDALQQAYDAYRPGMAAQEDTETPEPEMSKPHLGSTAMADQFAPIIPYVGAGGLRLGWTQKQVETVTGPLGDFVPVAKLWRRYTVGDQLWLYFNGAGDGLEKIVTLPGYGGRLFSLIDTNTPVEELSWREPSLVWNETLKFYTSPKGVLIQPVDGKCTHITVFDRKWQELCQ